MDNLVEALTRQHTEYAISKVGWCKLKPVSKPRWFLVVALELIYETLHLRFGFSFRLRLYNKDAVAMTERRAKREQRIAALSREAEALRLTLAETKEMGGSSVAREAGTTAPKPQP